MFQKIINSNRLLKILVVLFISCFATVLITSRIRRIIYLLNEKVNDVLNREVIALNIEKGILILGFILFYLILMIIGNRDIKLKNLYVMMFSPVLIMIIIYFFLKPEVNVVFVITVFLMVIWIVWVLLDFIIAVYKWLWISKDDRDKKQIDVAKLTFIWAIIIFIYGILFK